MNHGAIVAQGNTSEIKRIHGSGLLLTCLFKKTIELDGNIEILHAELKAWKSEGLIKKFQEFSRSKDNRLIKLQVDSRLKADHYRGSKHARHIQQTAAAEGQAGDESLRDQPVSTEGGI